MNHCQQNFTSTGRVIGENSDLLTQLVSPDSLVHEMMSMDFDFNPSAAE
jgi:hypothetical protein